ncbi:MAG: hypothetical protein NTU53_23070 [Planctomycetota bacterium]|nr:hypothetical protein [Planctomycetota bacterium]
MTESTATVEQVSGPTGEWEDVSVREATGGGLGKRLPKSKVIALARPGMVVEVANGGDGLGIIETITSDFAIVRFEDGRVETFYWGEVSLEAVAPDPAYIARTPGDDGLKLGKDASKVLGLARRLASVIQDFSNLETESECQATITESYEPMMLNLEKAYKALWQLAGKELLIQDSDEASSPAPRNEGPAVDPA